MKEKVVARLLNLIKIKSIVTFAFLGLAIYSAVKVIDLPEWLVPIITMGLKELFDKDKIKNTDKEGE